MIDPEFSAKWTAMKADTSLVLFDNRIIWLRDSGFVDCYQTTFYLQTLLNIFWAQQEHTVLFPWFKSKRNPSSPTKKTILNPGRETFFANLTSNIVFDRKLRIVDICGSFEDEEVLVSKKKKNLMLKEIC